MDKKRFQEFISVKTDEETLHRFRETPDGAILGRDFVEKFKDEYPWKVGQTYKLRELNDVSITFVGTFESDNEVYNTIILAGRRYLQEIRDSLGVVNQVFVKIEDPKYAGQIIAAIDAEVPERLPFKTTTKDQKSFLTAAVEDLRDIIQFSNLIMIITLCVVLVAVANTVSMATRDRVQEFGILRSLGFRRANILWLVLGESLVLSLAGGMLGLSAAFLLLNTSENLYGLRGVNMLIEVTPPVAAAAAVVSLVVGVVGGLLPAVGASRLRVVESLRNVD